MHHDQRVISTACACATINPQPWLIPTPLYLLHHPRQHRRPLRRPIKRRMLRLHQQKASLWCYFRSTALCSLGIFPSVKEPRISVGVTWRQKSLSLGKNNRTSESPIFSRDHPTPTPNSSPNCPSFSYNHAISKSL